MGAKTGINWTDSTVNPILARLPDGKLGFHCVKVSSECAFCYSETFNERTLPERGTGLPYQRRSGAQVEIVLHRPALDQVLSWGPKKGQPRKIFWCSMTDLFGEFVPSEMIQECLDVAVEGGESKGHISQILTKRPERMLAEIEAWTIRHRRPLPPCVWPGFSAGNRLLFFGKDGQEGRWRPVRELFRRGLAEGPIWCSYEPSIGPLIRPSRGLLERAHWRGIAATGLRWLVWGGESGHRGRGFDATWGLAVSRFAGEAGISVWGKQLGTHPLCPLDLPEGLDEDDHQAVVGCFLMTGESSVVGPDGRPYAGGTPLPGSKISANFGPKGDYFRDLWPEPLRVQQFPGESRPDSRTEFTSNTGPEAVLSEKEERP